MRSRDPLAIRTESQVIDLVRMRAENGKLTAHDRVAKVDVFPGTDGCPLAVGAARHRDRVRAQHTSVLPFLQYGDFFSRGNVPQSARGFSLSNRDIGCDPTAVRVV